MHEGSYCTYIMASRSQTLYVGVTGNLHRLVFEHKWKERDGFTACRGWYEPADYRRASDQMNV